MNRSCKTILACAALLFAFATGAVHAENSTGVSASQILIGSLMPYTGGASAFASIGNTEAAYFKMINEQGGVYGRKLLLDSVDDGYSPARAVQEVRKLVERDGVFLVLTPLGSAVNGAIQKYLNDKGVPQLFPISGSSRWNNPKEYKWTVPLLGRPDQQTEGGVYAEYILQRDKNAKVGVLYQNDEYGKDLLAGLRKGLGTAADKTIVASRPYETTDAIIDSSIDSIRAAGANTLLVFALPKYCAQAIRRAGDIAWHPTIIVGVVCSSIDFALKPAGIQNARGVLTGLWSKDPSDPRYAEDADVKAFRSFMAKYYPGGNVDLINAGAYMAAYSLVEILRRAGPQPTREKVLAIATSLKNWREPLLFDGLQSELTPSDYRSIRALPIMRFDGAHWVAESPIIRPH